MDHVLKALDEHIAYQNWLLKCEITAREALEKELDTVKVERKTLQEQIKLTAARAETAERECTRLRDMLSAIPPTLSREQWDYIRRAVAEDLPIAEPVGAQDNTKENKHE